MANRRHLALHLLSLAIAVAIALLLLEPVPPQVETATSGHAFPFDKLVHFLFFLGAAPIWRRSLSTLGLTAPGVATATTVAFAALYGGLLEIAQGLCTARDAELLDMVAGAAGALAAMLLRAAILRYRAAK